MPTNNSESQLLQTLKDGDKATRSFLVLVPNPNHRFCIIILVIISLFIPIGYFLYINQNEPEIQKGILGMIGAIAGGVIGGYFGAKLKT